MLKVLQIYGCWRLGSARFTFALKLNKLLYSVDCQKLSYRSVHRVQTLVKIVHILVVSLLEFSVLILVL